MYWHGGQSLQRLFPDYEVGFRQERMYLPELLCHRLPSEGCKTLSALILNYCWRTYSWIPAFPKCINLIWNVNSLVLVLNSNHLVHFLWRLLLPDKNDEAHYDAKSLFHFKWLVYFQAKLVFFCCCFFFWCYRVSNNLEFVHYIVHRYEE